MLDGSDERVPWGYCSSLSLFFNMYVCIQRIVLWSISIQTVAIVTRLKHAESNWWVENDLICEARRFGFFIKSMYHVIEFSSFRISSLKTWLRFCPYLIRQTSISLPKMKRQHKFSRFNIVVEIPSESQRVLNSLTENNFQAGFQQWWVKTYCACAADWKHRMVYGRPDSHFSLVK